MLLTAGTQLRPDLHEPGGQLLQLDEAAVGVPSLSATLGQECCQTVHAPQDATVQLLGPVSTKVARERGLVSPVQYTDGLLSVA